MVNVHSGASLDEAVACLLREVGGGLDGLVRDDEGRWRVSIVVNGSIRPPDTLTLASGDRIQLLLPMSGG